MATYLLPNLARVSALASKDCFEAVANEFDENGIERMFGHAPLHFSHSSTKLVTNDVSKPIWKTSSWYLFPNDKIFKGIDAKDEKSGFKCTLIPYKPPPAKPAPVTGNALKPTSAVVKSDSTAVSVNASGSNPVVDKIFKSSEFEDALSMCFKLIDPTNCSSSQTDLSVVKTAVLSLVDLSISQYSSSTLRINIFSKLLEIIQSPLIYRKPVIRAAISALGSIVCHEESLVNQTITFLAKILEFKGESLQYLKRVCIGALGRIGRRYPIYQNILLISLFEKYFDNNVSSQDVLCAILVAFGRFSQTNSQLRSMSMCRWLEAIDNQHHLFKAAGIQALGYASCPTANVVNDKEIEAICYSKAIGLLQYHKMDDYKGDEDNDPWKREEVCLVQVAAAKALGLLVRSCPSDWFPKLAKIFKAILSSPRYQGVVKASVLHTYGQITYYLNALSSPFFNPLKVLLFELSADDNTTVSAPSCYALSKFGLSHEANYLEVKTILKLKMSNLHQAKSETLVNYLKTWCKIISKTYRPILNQCSTIISPLYSDLYDPDSDLANSLSLLKDKNKVHNINRQPQQKLQDNMALLDTAFTNFQHLVILVQCFSPTVVQAILSLIKKPSLIDQTGFRKALRDKILIQRSKGFMRNGEETYENALKELSSDVTKRKSFIQYLKTPELLNDPVKQHPNQAAASAVPLTNITLLPPSSPQKSLLLKPHASILRAKPPASKPATTSSSTTTATGSTPTPLAASSIFGKPLALIQQTPQQQQQSIANATQQSSNSTTHAATSRIFWPEQEYLSSHQLVDTQQQQSISAKISPDSFVFEIEDEPTTTKPLTTAQSTTSPVTNSNGMTSLFSPLQPISEDTISLSNSTPSPPIAKISPTMMSTKPPQANASTPPLQTVSPQPTSQILFPSMKAVEERVQQQSTATTNLFAPLQLIGNAESSVNIFDDHQLTVGDESAGEEGKELETSSSPFVQSSDTDDGLVISDDDNDDDDDDDDDELEIDEEDKEIGDEEVSGDDSNQQATTGRKRAFSLIDQLETEAEKDAEEIKQQLLQQQDSTTADSGEAKTDPDKPVKLSRKQRKLLKNAKKQKKNQEKLAKRKIAFAYKQEKQQLKQKEKQLQQQQQPLKKQKKGGQQSANNNEPSNLYVGINFSEKKQQPQVLCQFYKLGMCNKGDECTFKHEGPVPEKKIELCKFFKMGSCLKGSECTFSHDLKLDPCKFFNGPAGCTNKDCPYGHFYSQELQQQLLQQQQQNQQNQQQSQQQQDNSLNDNYYSNLGSEDTVSNLMDFSNNTKSINNNNNSITNNNNSIMNSNMIGMTNNNNNFNNFNTNNFNNNNNYNNGLFNNFGNQLQNNNNNQYMNNNQNNRMTNTINQFGIDPRRGKSTNANQQQNRQAFSNFNQQAQQQTMNQQHSPILQGQQQQIISPTSMVSQNQQQQQQQQQQINPIYKRI
ncbi:CCCH-type zinc finger-containing protein [Heterostelium album PN500]|uniref:CCCH-type zinc finger-containing protein n=1 Tax=Heterostelium pallidum (strain ATCC 26659 / Pp 5 / PN500) TaxID=670386 RepID=D3BV62_HETP5|nr:CCCH-type zinc finger-containing protein [Heterostelium album PN500]EFA74704.1 CCCH-type zinc finger-containing protein [Heterostelium album PN500]|eukprot:XP_020426838.1 CCCH-type zinc finger-containing protein [Heterostelium album PN500]